MFKNYRKKLCIHSRPVNSACKGFSHEVINNYIDISSKLWLTLYLLYINY